MPTGKIEVPMTHDRRTAGGQHLFKVDNAIAQGAAARNIYLTKNALPPEINPADVKLKVTIEWETLPGRAASS